MKVFELVNEIYNLKELIKDFTYCQNVSFSSDYIRYDDLHKVYEIKRCTEPFMYVVEIYNHLGEIKFVISKYKVSVLKNTTGYDNAATLLGYLNEFKDLATVEIYRALDRYNKIQSDCKNLEEELNAL